MSSTEMDVDRQSGGAGGPKAPRWAWWVSTGLGSGCLKPAPGTWGSLAGLMGWWLFVVLACTPFVNWALLHPHHRLLSFYILGMEAIHLLVLASMTWLAIRAADHVVRETGQKDPGFIVADEWVGMWVTLWPLRWTVAQQSFRFFGHGAWRWCLLLALPFALFRLLDIWKPWPIRQIQDLPGGQGVVADDLVAGLFALPIVILGLPLILAWIQR